MLQSRSRPAPCLGQRLAIGMSRCALVAFALAAAGCASDQEQRRQAYAQQAYQMRGPVAPQPEVEEDGLPAQVAPLSNRRREPDDPREPYSPNYGTTTVERRAALPAPTQVAERHRSAAY